MSNIVLFPAQVLLYRKQTITRTKYLHPAMVTPEWRIETLILMPMFWYRAVGSSINGLHNIETILFHGLK